jgi:hypothetical protein
MYYIIETEIDRKIMGNCYPQIDLIDPSDVADLLSSWEYPADNTSFIITMDKKAKQTDFLNNLQISGASGFFISQKAKDIFDQFKLMQHKYYPTKVKGWDMPYYWLHCSEPKLTHLIDYNESTFFETKWTFKENPIKLTSYNEYEQLKKEKGASFGVSLEKIISNNNYIKSLDLIEFLPLSGSELYISEKLKSALEQNHVTGFKTQEAENLIIR